MLKRLRGLSMAGRRALLDLFTKSAADYLDGWFEGDLIKALYGFDAVVGNYASPETPGTAYVMLHHAFGEVNGQKRVWGHAIGGMGAITQAMAKAAAAAGAEIETGAAVRELIVERGGVKGVVLADDRTIRATVVASSVNPRLLYTRLLPADALPADFRDPDGALAMRLRHLPHERGVVILAAIRGASRGRRAASTIPPASSWRRASPTWTAPIRTPAIRAGAGNRSSRC